MRWLAALLIASSALVSAPAAMARKSDTRATPSVDILALNSEMARFLVRHVSPNLSPTKRAQALLHAIFDQKGLGISYHSTATQTAVETFRQRRGNCLSFTILYVAMARHLGLAAYFEEVDEVISWNRRGEVVVRNQHMVADVEVENGHQMVDFLPEAEKRYRSIRRISDQRALAHYFNNRGVDALAAGDAEAALGFFGQALEADDSFSYAWTDRGVALRRLGDLEAAESSHLRALEIDPGETAALTNLASLYLASGRRQEAEPLIRRVDRDLARNPFHHFRQGVVRLQGGEAEAAIRHFREAIRRMPEEPEFHAALSDALLRAGQLRAARESLERAIPLTPDSGEQDRLREKLAALEDGL